MEVNDCFCLIILISKVLILKKTIFICFLETSTSDPTLKLKIVLKNIAISVGKITVNSQYAKQVVFILSKQDGEPLPEYHQVLNYIKSFH